MKPTNIYLSDAQKNRLKEIQELLGLSMSEIIRRAIDEYVYRQKRKEKR